MATERNRGNRGNTEERNRGNRGNTEERNRGNKHMQLQIVGNVEKVSTFGDKGKHTRFTLIDSVSETKLPFKSFNTTDVQYDALCKAEYEKQMITVTFDITYSFYNDKVTMVLVATEIEKR